MRDNAWLKNQLDFLLKKHFPEVVITNPITIHFGREAKYRFGSIKLLKKRFNFGRGFKLLARGEPEKSIITITSMFKDESIPQDVVLYTISHELCHYSHGFSSSNRRLFKYPHHGGIVNRELRERSLVGLITAYKTWLATYRKKIISARKIF